MSGADPLQLAREVGLCARCHHARVIVNRNGSRFYLCEMAKEDRRFPKYPPLPVWACDGWEPIERVGQTEESE